MKPKATLKTALLAIGLLLQFNLQATIHYVKSGGTGDGTSWNNAAGNIQDMIDNASAEDEVWVAKGTYYPTKELEPRVERSKTFLLKEGVHLYGGFAGNETGIDKRAKSDKDRNGTIEAWEFTNETILSGDIDGVKDIWCKEESTNNSWKWKVAGNEGNCYHVVYCQTSFINQTNIDGVTISDGCQSKNKSSAIGGGAYLQGNVLLVNSVIKNNYTYAFNELSGSSTVVAESYVYGAGIYNNGGLVLDCCITENYAYAYSKTTISASKDSNATSSAHTYVYGSGIYNKKGTIENCLIFNNSAFSDVKREFTSNATTRGHTSQQHRGGGFYGEGNIKNCIIKNNNGDGIYVLLNSEIDNCQITNNNGCGIRGEGTIGNHNGINVRNCSVSNNTSAGIYGANTVELCIVMHNSGSGITAENVLNSTITDNVGTGISTSGKASYCTVMNNRDVYYGGIFNNGGIIEYCIVANNSSSATGGIYNKAGVVKYCIVTNNNGTGIHNWNEWASAYTYCCTIVGNTKDTGSSRPAGNSTGRNHFSNNVTSSVNKEFDFINPTSFSGSATTEKQKAELLAADWRLKEGSQNINIGDVKNIPEDILNESDFDGNNRVSLGKIDLGAYEYYMPLISLPFIESFNCCKNFYESSFLYGSVTINGMNNMKWVINNEKAVFDYTNNSNLKDYSESFFSYTIDATESTSVILKYNLSFHAYAGSSSPTIEQLSVEYSTDLENWEVIANYDNTNGNIREKTYQHDISEFVLGKEFWVRFRAYGENSNNIEKWEIDNIIIKSEEDEDPQPANHYHINVIFDDKGEVLLNGSNILTKKVESDESVTIMMFPHNGYEIESVFFNDEDVTSKLVNNTFNSPAISQNSTFEVVFKQIGTVAINVINQNKINIKSVSNGIVVETTEQMPVSVYTISGQIIYQTIANGKAEIPLNKGIYIVRVNNGSQKVIVK